jgi:hypothetical protein
VASDGVTAMFNKHARTKSNATGANTANAAKEEEIRNEADKRAAVEQPTSPSRPAYSERSVTTTGPVNSVEEPVVKEGDETAMNVVNNVRSSWNRNHSY